MCCSCWKEEGSPTELPPNFEEFRKLHDDIYDQPNGGAGGGLHIQLDDNNLEDRHMEPDPRLTTIEEACLAQLRKMTEAQRYASMGKIDGCF